MDSLALMDVLGQLANLGTLVGLGHEVLPVQQVPLDLEVSQEIPEHLEDKVQEVLLEIQDLMVYLDLQDSQDLSEQPVCSEIKRLLPNFSV